MGKWLLKIDNDPYMKWGVERGMVDKQEIKNTVFRYKALIMDTLKEVFSYPYHPRTQMVLFEIHGNTGLFAISVTPFVHLGEQIFENADEESVDDLRMKWVSIKAYQEDENWDDDVYDDLVDEMDEYAVEQIISLFNECFKEAGGVHTHIQYYLQGQSRASVLDLKNNIWIRTQDLIK